MKNLIKALIALQSELKPVPKDAENPYFKSRYATLTAIWESVQPLLQKHGFAVTQLVVSESIWNNGNHANTVVLKTLLYHDSGEFLESLYPIVPVKQDPQGYGSATTYARRYALAAILGVCLEDDDGNAASQPSTNKPVSSAEDAAKAVFPGTVNTADMPISDPQRKRLFAIAKEAKRTEEEIKQVISQFGYKSTSEIKKKDYDSIVQRVQLEDVPF